MSRILHLTLTKKWFAAIASGDKTEEYRDIKRYWIKRLTKPEYHSLTSLELMKALCHKETFTEEYDIIQFRNGYSKDAPMMQVELLGIHYGIPAKLEWCEQPYGRWYFCLELGKILSIKNYKPIKTIQ